FFDDVCESLTYLCSFGSRLSSPDELAIASAAALSATSIAAIPSKSFRITSPLGSTDRRRDSNPASSTDLRFRGRFPVSEAFTPAGRTAPSNQSPAAAVACEALTASAETRQ